MRCLEKAGDIERLERVLDESHEKRHRTTHLRRLLSEYEMAMRVGGRDVARHALREARLLAPGDATVLDLVRRLEERWPVQRTLRLVIGETRVRLVSRLPVIAGRADADIVVRGASVSRRHCAADRRGDEVIIRDLGSRNGTFVNGVLLAGEIALSGPAEIGLGDDVTLDVRLAEHGLTFEVVRGLDRGDRIIVGKGDALRVSGLAATFAFVADRVMLEADSGVAVQLADQPVVAAIDLLHGDSLVVGGVPVEVLA